jgi:TolB protein
MRPMKTSATSPTPLPTPTGTTAATPPESRMTIPPEQPQSATAGRFGATALAALTAVGLAAAGCTFSKPRELMHTVNGVEVGSSGRPKIDPSKRGVIGGAGAFPTSRPVADPWGPAPLAAGLDPVSPVPVNVFGEMGAPRAVSRVVGDAGFQQHTFTDEGADSDVAADPTGKWLAFASTRHNDRTDIYLQRADGTAVTQLTSDQADDAFPCISPDGKKVAFASTRAGAWHVYTMDVDGRNVVQVTDGTMQCVHPTYSPDGGRIAYAAIGSRSAQWELWVADLKTGEKRMVGYGLFPRWSPDKTVDRIAFQKSRQRGSRWFSLWTLDLIEGEGRRLTEVVSSPNAAVVSPCWSPDGRRLAFATVVEPAVIGKERDARRAKLAKQYGQQDIWTVDSDGTNRQRLTDGNGTNLSPFWGADNRVFFISDRGGADCVWSVRADPRRAFDGVTGNDRGPDGVGFGRGALAPLPPPPGADPFQAGGPGQSGAVPRGSRGSASTDPRE